MQGLERSPAKILEHVDVVFNNTRGIQHILEQHNVLYTGSDKIASALAGNKILAKEKAKSLNIKTPIYVASTKEDSVSAKAKEIFFSMPQPVIIKAVHGHDSYLARNFAEIISALEEINDAAVAEEYIAGREAVCVVLNNFRNEDTYATPPGNFTLEEKREVERLAKLIHSSFGLSHYSQSHFLVTPRRGIYFLEVNPSPHIFEDSVFLDSLSSVGITMPQFLHHVLSLAIEGK